MNANLQHFWRDKRNQLVGILGRDVWVTDRGAGGHDDPRILPPLTGSKPGVTEGGHNRYLRFRSVRKPSLRVAAHHRPGGVKRARDRVAVIYRYLSAVFRSTPNNRRPARSVFECRARLEPRANALQVIASLLAASSRVAAPT